MAHPLPHKVKSTLLHVKQKNGEIYVFEKKALYDPEKRCAKAQGIRLIGKIPVGETDMVPVKNRTTVAEDEVAGQPADLARENRSSAATMKIAGSTALLLAIAKAAKIDEDLRSVWDEKTVNAVLSLAIYSLLTDSPLTEFNSWAEGHEHPLGTTLSPEAIKALSSVIGDPMCCEALFQTRFKRAEDDNVIAYLSTARKTDPGQNTDISEMTVYKGRESCLPLAWQKVVLPINGQTLDGLSTSQGKKPNIALVTDEIRSAKVNFVNLHKHGINFVIPVNLELKPVNEAWNEYKDFYRDARYFVGELDTYARTIPIALQVDRESGRIVDAKEETENTETVNGYLHLFKSTTLTQTEELDFYHQITRFERDWISGHRDEKSPLLKFFKGPPAKEASVPLERDYDEINRALLEKGCYAIISKSALTALDAYRIYEGLDVVNQCFGKSSLTAEMKADETIESQNARSLIAFVAYAILNELTERWREAQTSCVADVSLANVRSILVEFENIRLIRVPGYDARYGKVTDEEKVLADLLGFPALFESVPSSL